MAGRYKAAGIGFRIGRSVIVVLTLVADGEDGHGFVVFDFEKGHITCAAEGNKHLAQERVVGAALRQLKGNSCRKAMLFPIASRARSAA